MKFGIMFANVGPFAYGENLAALAQIAEEVGIESIWTVEHVVVPLGYQSRYPYTSSGKMPGDDNATIPDPIVPLAFAAAVTTSLRLGTAIVILPQRHPAYVAKEMATLDTLSGGRAILGVGVGWLAEEFAVVGVPFAERAARTEESIRAIRSLWKDAPEAFDGRYYRWGPVESNPKPVQKPGVPIFIGGQTDAAARRAARCGDGFLPAQGDVEHLARWFAVLREECARIGRNPAEIELNAGGYFLDPNAMSQYRDLGVSRVIISPPAFDPEGLRKGLHEFADRVMARA